MSNYYKLRIQDLEASRLKLIADVMELRAELEKAQKALKRSKTKLKHVSTVLDRYELAAAEKILQTCLSVSTATTTPTTQF